MILFYSLLIRSFSFTISWTCTIVFHLPPTLVNFPVSFYISLSHTKSFVLWPIEIYRVICVHHRGWVTAENNDFPPSRIYQKPLVQQGEVGSREPLPLLWLVIDRATAHNHNCWRFTMAMTVFCPSCPCSPSLCLLRVCLFVWGIIC